MSEGKNEEENGYGVEDLLELRIWNKRLGGHMWPIGSSL
jgi:hypothetical protein